jgi:hypothetical protein
VMQQQLRIREWDGQEGPEDAGTPPPARRPDTSHTGKHYPPARKPRSGGFKPPRPK